MAGFDLVSRSIPAIYDLNWRFLVLLLVAGILTIFFLFYFNRLVASILSYSLRVYTWRTYQVYLDIKSIQFSLLAGRIFFKGLQYHGQNETILVTDGYITWQYWLRRVKEVDCNKTVEVQRDSDSEAEIGSEPRGNDAGSRHGHMNVNQRLPCRIEARFRGLEWFIYNRNPAYETMLENLLQRHDSSSINPENDGLRRRTAFDQFPKEKPEHSEKGIISDYRDIKPGGESIRSIEDGSHTSSRARHEQEDTASDILRKGQTHTTSLPAWLRFLPIGLQCSKIGVVMGNTGTRTILTAKCERLHGQISAKASGPLDLFKQTIELDMTHPLIQFKNNKSFEDTKAQHGAASSNIDPNAWKRSVRLPPLLRKMLHGLLPERLTWWLGHKHRKPLYKGRPVESFINTQHRWLGLNRYLDEEDDRLEQERWRAVDYARSPVLLEAPSMALDVHWDVPGKVSSEPKADGVEPQSPTLNVNGSESPDWGINIRIRGGSINYGPWADRQRTDLQSMFFPSTFKDTEPAASLLPGQVRISTTFQLLIEIEDDTVLRIPTRESSKDWKWRGKAAAETMNRVKSEAKAQRSRRKKSSATNSVFDSRPFGWLDICLSKDSTVTFLMDMVPGHDGYHNRVTVDLRRPEISTSVNHGLFCRAKSQVLSCDFPNPLKWNSLHEWRISVQGISTEIFLLRDHLFLVNDLISDWTSGPPGDFYTFVPYKYLIEMHTTDLTLFLNVNESNIINSPANLEDNNYVKVKGQDLNSSFTIDASAYRPTKGSFEFSSIIRRASIEMRTSRRNTYSAFLESPIVGFLKQVQVDGVFTNYSTTSPELTDELTLNIHGESPRVILHGFVIRYLMKVKDNYFGDDIHFRTFDEFQRQMSVAKGQSTDPPKSSQHHRLSNDLDVALRITTVRSCAFLPCALYSASETIKMEMSSIAADLRFTSHYMDLSLSISPLSLSCAPFEDQSAIHSQSSATQLFIDGVTIYGHRLFGLPPVEPTYVCNWEFDVGSIFGECSLDFLHDVTRAARAFDFTFDDAENILPLGSASVIHDVTFLRAEISPITIWIRLEERSILCQIGKIIMSSHDWADANISKQGHLIVPNLTLALVDTSQAIKSGNQNQPWVKPLAYMDLSASMWFRQRQHGHADKLRLQQRHLKTQDSRTYRTSWLLHTFDLLPTSATPWDQNHLENPTIPVPPLPQPLASPYKTKSVLLPEQPGTTSRKSHSSSEVLGSSSFLPQSRTSRRRSSSITSVHQGAQHGQTKKPSTRGKHFSESYFPGVKVESKSSRAGFGFSSPYKKPYFPLHCTRLDLSDIPEAFAIEDRSELLKASARHPRSSSVPPYVRSGTTELLIDLGPVIKVFCNSSGLTFLGEVLQNPAAESPTALLDELQRETVNAVLDRITRGKKATSFEVSLWTGLSLVKIILRPVGNADSQISNPTINAESDGLVMTSRISKDVHGAATEIASANTTLHVIANEFNMWVSEPDDVTRLQGQTLLKVSVFSPTFWTTFKDSSKGLSFSIQEMTFEIQGDRILHLPAVIDQVKSSIHQFQRIYKQYLRSREALLQQLVVSLVSNGKDVPDPAFLASGTYITRLTSDHVRVSDSWKLLSRLRQIFRYAPESAKDSILRNCSDQSLVTSNDAASQVIKAFENWRTWDVLHARQSILVKLVFGTMVEDADKKRAKESALELVFLAGRLRTLLFFRLKTNELLFDEIKLSVDRNKSSRTGDNNAYAVVPVMHVHCSTHRILLSTTWDIHELISLYTRYLAQSKIVQAQSAGSTGPMQIYQVQLLCNIDNFVCAFGTVNTMSNVTSRGLKLSVLQLDHDNKHLVLLSEALAIESHGNSRKILSFMLQYPRLSISAVQRDIKTSSVQSLKVAGLCKGLQLQILEEPLFLLHFGQTLLRDEVHSIKMALRSMQRNKSKVSLKPNIDEASRISFVQVILILQSYTLSIMILPSLHYVLSGQAAKSNIDHSLDTVTKISCYYDVLRYAHAFVTSIDSNAETISTFVFPPMYGHLRLMRAVKEQTVRARGVVEKTHFDARSVHALLVILNKPEIASFASRLQMESGNFLSTIERSTDRLEIEALPASETKIATLYDVSFNMAGLGVLAAAPLSSDNSGKVALQLDLGGLYLEARNSVDTSQGKTIPDIEMKLVGTGARVYHVMGEHRESIGDVRIQAVFRTSSVFDEDGNPARIFEVQSKGLEINLQVATIPALLDILGHLQRNLKDIDLSQEVSTLRKLRHPSRISQLDLSGPLAAQRSEQDHHSLKSLFNAMYSLDMSDIRLIWRVGDSNAVSPGRQAEDLVLSLSKVEFATKKANFARLSVQGVQLQMTPWTQALTTRSSNSALLPEVVFNVAYMSSTTDRRLAFHAAGKALDLRLTSRFILPASDLRRSIASSVQKVRQITVQWNFPTPQSEGSKKHILSDKNLTSLQVDADFAGAVVHIQGADATETSTNSANILRTNRVPQRSKHIQFPGGYAGTETVLRSPGVAFKVHYKDRGERAKSLSAETKVSASSNTLHSSVVPLILEITSSVKEVVGEPLEEPEQNGPSPIKPDPEGSTGLPTDPNTIFGDCQINLGLRICKQNFGLTCQPIAKVAATAQLDEIYVTVNTVQNNDHGQFYSLAAAVKNLAIDVQHAYSRESTGQLKIRSIFLSMMNSKHVGGAEGLSVILAIGPTTATVNARQIQDVLLFQDIWIPSEIEETTFQAQPSPSSEPQAVMIQRYQQVAAASAFPWNATLRLTEIDIQLDLGQSLGRSTIIISQVWLSSSKSSQAEQNLCFGLAKIVGRSTGRMSGLIELENLKLKTSIKWPSNNGYLQRTPLIQASAGFEQLKIKAGLDYQTFAVLLMTGFDFLMYNVRDVQSSSNDHLVAILKSETAQVYCTTLSASQALALWQAGERFISEKKMAYQASLAEAERYLRRRPSVLASARLPKERAPPSEDVAKAPLQLRTRVVVTLESISFGTFPSTFSDNQIFKLEALDVSARFSSMLKGGRIQSNLGLKLGQLRISLSPIGRPSLATAIEDLDVDELVSSALRSQGGTILKVPMVLASMQTWQDPHSRHIDFIFKSSFQGRVDVGWSYARISFIRGMWNNHARALAQRLGKPLPKSALQITGGPEAEGRDLQNESDPSKQTKITAVVNVPLSKYTYTALEPPIIETPQLRDMGEATPPLEWIGLHRERLPNVTHQIVIVSLLEIAKEVEDAYARILGSSSA